MSVTQKGHFSNECASLSAPSYPTKQIYAQFKGEKVGYLLVETNFYDFNNLAVNI